MEVKCVVACYNAGGEPDLYFVKVKCHPDDYDIGGHYEMAEGAATEEGYSGPMVVFDENDGPSGLFKLFVWDSASIV